MLTNGFKVGEYRPDDSRDEVEIRARFPESDRTITGIQNLNVTTLEGLIPVSSFISVIPKENVQSVNRRNGKFTQQVGAATIDESQVSEKVEEIAYNRHTFIPGKKRGNTCKYCHVSNH